MVSQVALASQQVVRSALLLAAASHAVAAQVREAALDFCTKSDPHAMVVHTAFAVQHAVFFAAESPPGRATVEALTV
jgi:hypothetical protein